MLDGNYLDVGGAEITWRAADTLVWLDPPVVVGVLRTLRRTGSRVIRRTELWNGNRQAAGALSPKSLFRLVRNWPSYSTRIQELLDDGSYARLRVLHLRRREEVAVLMTGDPNDC